MIVLTINGKQMEMERPQLLVDYLYALGVNIHHIAIAYNGNVVPKSELTGVTLLDGDKVEIVRAVGGG